MEGGGRVLLCAQRLYNRRDQLDCSPPNGLNHYLPLNMIGAHSTGERFRATIALLLYNPRLNVITFPAFFAFNVINVYIYAVPFECKCSYSFIQFFMKHLYLLISWPEGGEGGSLIFSYIRRLRSSVWVPNFEFHYFLGFFRKNEYFLGVITKLEYI